MFGKNFIFIFILTVCSVFTLLSCKKDNTAIVDTKWSVDNLNYQASNLGGVLMKNDTGTIFGAVTDKKDAIIILFKNAPSTGTYSLVDIRVKTKAIEYADNECSMLITDNNTKKSYWSLYENGGAVNISMSGKKVVATFDNVKLALVDLTTTDLLEVSASGKIIEK